MSRESTELFARGTQDSVSRRSLLKASALIAGAVAAAGTVGGAVAEEAVAPDAGAAPEPAYKVYDTDMIVIGAGFGGMAAAIECDLVGRNCILIDKGPYGFGGGTGMNWDIAWRFMPDLRNEPAFGYLSNGKLLEKAATEDPHLPAILQILNNGELAPRRNEDGTICWYLNTPRAFGIEGGFPRHQLDKAEASPFVTVHDRTVITDLIINQAGVCVGAMGVHTPSGEFRVYRCPATLLCTGASTWIFGHSTVAAKTLGSPDNTGDVDMAVFRHGGTIGDSEWSAYDLISIYPTGIAYAFNSGIGADANDYSVILDRDGQPLLTDPSLDYTEFLASRSYFNRTLAAELLKGRGTDKGGLYVDLSNPELVEHMRRTYRRSFDLWRKQFGIDPSEELVEIGFEMYEHGGTPVIDENAMSIDFPGLFCARGAGICGELGGNACYLGLRMGSYIVRQAAAYIDSLESLDFDWDAVDAEYDRLAEIRTRSAEGGLSPIQVRHEIQEAVSDCLGLIRETEALQAAEAELMRIRDEDLPRMVCGEQTLTYNLDWKTAIENYSMLDVALLSVKATLFREETRGQYIRPDFPEMDDENWHCMVVANYRDGEYVLSKRELSEASWEE